MATVGELDVVIRGKANQLDRDLKQAEGKVKASSDRMAKSMQTTMNFGKVWAAVNAVESAIKLASVATDVWNGNLVKAAETIKTLPWGFGQAATAAGELYLKLSGLQEKLDAARVGRDQSKVDLDRARRGQEAVEKLQNELELIQAPDDKARERVRIEQQNRELMKLAEEQTDPKNWGFGEEIRQLAEQLRSARLRQVDQKDEKKKKIADVGTTISANQIGLGLATGLNKAPDKRGQDKTNYLLAEISGKIERNRAVALAG